MREELERLLLTIKNEIVSYNNKLNPYDSTTDKMIYLGRIESMQFVEQRIEMMLEKYRGK